jgi:hypothetical protein
LSLWTGAPIDLAVLAVAVSVTVGGETGAVTTGGRLTRLAGGLVATAVLGWAVRLLPSEIWFFTGLAAVSVGATLMAGLGRWGKTAGGVLIRSVSALVFFPAPMAVHLSAYPGLILLTVAVTLAVSFLAGFLGPREPVAEISDSTATSLPVSLARAGQQAAAFLLTLTLVSWWLPSEVPWAFITAFVVSVSTRTRLELAVKSIARLLGAGGGALVGIAAVGLIAPLGPWLAVLMLAVLSAGAYLRQFSYAWWAATITLLLTWLYALLDPTAPVPVLPRLEGIVLGAAAAVLAAFLLVPLPSRRILRGLLGRALAELDAVLVRVAEGSPELTPAWDEFDRQLAVFEKTARSAGLRRLMRWHPVAGWLPMVAVLREAAEAVVGVVSASRGPLPSAGLVRKALGSVRKVLAGKESEAPAAWTGGSAGEQAALGTLYEALRVLYVAVSLGPKRPKAGRGTTESGSDTPAQ